MVASLGTAVTAATMFAAPTSVVGPAAVALSDSPGPSFA